MRYLGIVAAVAVCLAVAATAGAMDVSLYADTAPNVYGYDAWQAQAFAAASAGSFVNMGSGAFPGTTTFKAEEAIVYSTPDYGKRLMWVYWIPGQTVAGLTGNFQAKDAMDWAGIKYTPADDGVNLIPDGPDVGWWTPHYSWADYTNAQNVSGVIGTFGDAWWPDGTPEAIAAQVSDMYTYQTFWTGEVRYRANENAPWTVQTLELQLVPEPLTMAGLFLGLAGVGNYIRKRRMA